MLMRFHGVMLLACVVWTGCPTGSEVPKDLADTDTDTDTDSDTDTDTDTDECDGFVDLDGDGYGGAAATPDDCDESRVSNSLDCDDSDPAAGGGVEVPYNGRDEDCDPTTPDDDLDGDGALVADDCNDQNPNSTTVATDADCDGVVTALDCDDTDPTSLVQALDADCDGAGTAEDCDDQDPGLGSMAYDADCDGLLVGLDCNDTDAEIGDPSLDADCDGTPTEEDCDDTNPTVPNSSDDDCDLVHRDDDCNDSDARYGDRLLDADCDRVLTADDCDDTRGGHWNRDPVSGACIEGTDLGDLTAQQDYIAFLDRMYLAGDVNGDGLGDLIVTDTGQNDVMIVIGGTSARQELNVGQGTYVLAAGDCGETPTGASAAGDVDGDGFDDLRVSFPSCPIAVLSGADLVGGTPGSMTEIPVPTGTLGDVIFEIAIEGNTVNVDDLDGNGIRDVMVLGTDPALGPKAPKELYVFRDIHHQGLSGPLGSADADFVIDPFVTDRVIGRVSTVADVDGDGLREIAIGFGSQLYFFEPEERPGSAVYIFHTGALSSAPTSPADAQQAIIDTAGDFDSFGSVLLNRVDVDGDGSEDLLISARRGDESYYTPGIAAVSGIQLAAGGDIDIHTDAALILPHGQRLFGNDYFAENLVSLGDLDGDGLPEFFASDFNECCYTQHYFSVFSGGQVRWGERSTPYEGGYWGEVSDVQAAGSPVLVPGDIDGDGHDDLVLGNTVLWGPIVP